MRVGLLSDVHANFAALRATLRHLEREGAEALLCAGDIVGYGPEPNECVEALASAGAVTVAGNHDLMALGMLDAAHEGPNVRASTAWTRRQLGDDARAWLGGLPLVATCGPIVVAHGSLDDPERYIERDGPSAAQLAELARRWGDARLLVLGHTHRPRLFQEGTGDSRPALAGGTMRLGSQRALVNPGSVGQSRQRELEPKARCALVELESATLDFYSLSYAVAETRRLLSVKSLPRSSVHLVPGRAAAALRRLASFVRRPPLR